MGINKTDVKYGMVTQERLDNLVKSIFDKPIPPHKKRHYGCRSIPLPANWDELRERIIERDSVCVECGTSGHGIHHLDKDRTNNNDDNLVYLCWSCHSKKHH